MEEQRKKTGIELLPSLKKQMKQRANDLGVPLWAVLQEAIQQYLDVPPPPDSLQHLSPRDQAIHRRLQAVLDHSDPRAVEWIDGNLKMFVEALDGRKKPPSRKLGS